MEWNPSALNPEVLDLWPLHTTTDYPVKLSLKKPAGRFVAFLKWLDRSPNHVNSFRSSLSPITLSSYTMGYLPVESLELANLVFFGITILPVCYCFYMHGLHGIGPWLHGLIWNTLRLAGNGIAFKALVATGIPNIITPLVIQGCGFSSFAIMNLAFLNESWVIQAPNIAIKADLVRLAMFLSLKTFLGGPPRGARSLPICYWSSAMSLEWPVSQDLSFWRLVLLFGLQAGFLQAWCW